jgi:diaminopimelate epimerase
MEINFSKLSAAGNDFVLIDNRNNIIPKEDYPYIAKKLCDRKYSIGADGLILLENSKNQDFKMKYFNSDGSCACMCGNGGRSIAKFAYDLGLVGSKMVFETDAGVVNAEVLVQDRVKLNLYAPKDLRQNMKLQVEGKTFDADFINTGVPHVVVFIDDIKSIDVFKYGRLIRHSETFSPQGTNVNFVQVLEKNKLFVRTYERGVEDETLACGTGITASGIVSVLKGFTKSPVNIVSRGGDELSVSFGIDSNLQINNVVLEGPAVISFRGIINHKGRI